MKKYNHIIIPIIQLTIAVLAIFFYIIIASTGQNMDKWQPALTMSIIFGATAIIEIVRTKKESKDNGTSSKLSKIPSKDKDK